jgi:hypothetical protein
MAKMIKRAFKLSDDVMLERAAVFHDALESELSSFTERFPWMDATWLKAKGDDFFRAGDARSALSAYSAAIDVDEEYAACKKKKVGSH